jgi:anti-sigma factor RsiW
MNCQHCQTLLLDHLYGLLDEQEAAALDAHLASCPACAAASAETARVRGLIARAAKSAFPDTKFEAPAPQPSNSGIHTPVPSKAAALSVPSGGERKSLSRRVAAILPWAVATAVLIAIPSTVVPVLNIHKNADRTHRDAETARLSAEDATKSVELARAEVKKSLSGAEFQVYAAKQAETALAGRWMDEQDKLAKNATVRKFSVDVLKPANVTPGAPNDFIVVVNDRRDLWETTGKNLVAEIHAVDASDAVIFTQPLNIERTAERRHALRLPAGAWAKVKPSAELFLVVAQVDEKTQARTELQERIRLAGPVFATLLVTDKAMYRPGERLFFRSLTLDRVTFKPPTRDQILKYELLQQDGRTPVHGLSVTGTTDAVRVSPEGQVTPVRDAAGQPIRGVGCGEFVLPPDLPDGDYVLRLTEGVHPGGFPATIPVPVTRVVKVRSGSADVYRKDIHFTRESFVPGDTVEAFAELKLQDKPQPNGVVLSAVAEADNEPLAGVEVAKTTDANGRAKVRFALPPELLNADVRLKVKFRTPHGDEVVATRVPVVGNRVIVEFFPESGDSIIAGVPCKVYVRATTPAGQPVNFRGVITDGRQTLAKVESLNDPNERGANRGLASFTYTPQLGTKVWLKLESPSTVYAPILPGVPVHNASVSLLGGPGATAMRTGFLLPPVKAEGVVMTVLDPVTAPGEPIRVQLHSVGQPRTLVVGAYTRGKLSDTQKVTVEPEEPQTIRLMAGTDPRGGVVRITAFEEIDEKQQDMKPVAERLVFRKPGEVLNLAFSLGATPQAATVPVPPNTALTCNIAATNEKGNPVAAILWAGVVNSGVAPGAKDRLLPTHFLLAGEVKTPDELEYADFLLTDHPKAPEALDLLLGTQGWRRFAEQTTVQVFPQPAGKPLVYSAPQPDTARWMLQHGGYATWTEPAPLRDYRELHRKFAPRYEAAVKAVAQAQAALDKAREEAKEAKAVSQATAIAGAATREAEEKAAKAEAAKEPVRLFRANVWYGVAGLAALALCCGLVSAVRPSGRLPLGFSTLGSVGLAAFLVVASGWGDSKVAASDATAKLEAPLADQSLPESDRLAHREKANLAGAQPAPPAAPPRADVNPGQPSTMTLPPSPPDALGTKKSDTPTEPLQATTDGVVSPNAAPTGPKPQPKSMAAKDSGRPAAAFQPYPPPVIASGFGRHTADMKGVAGNATVPATPANPVTVPSPPAPSAKDHVPSALAPPAPIPGTGGWDPDRANGVSFADLDRSQRSLRFNLRKRYDPAHDAAEKAEALKKATDFANKYARDRGTEPATPLGDQYYLAGDAAKAKPPEVPTGAATPADAFGSPHLRGAAVAPQPPLVVREYAAPRPAPAQLAEAPEPADTVLWQPIIVLPTDGKTVLHFTIGIAPGGYEVVIAGHTADGRLGAKRGLIPVLPQSAPNAPGGQGVPKDPILPPGAVPPNPPPAP